MSPRTPFHQLPPQTQAGILCTEVQFQNFAAAQSGFPNGFFGESAAAEYLRQFCGIDSRRELETSERACRKLQVLRTEYDAWRGVIPRPPEAAP
jgi:hypothetical protein